MLTHVFPADLEETAKERWSTCTQWALRIVLFVEEPTKIVELDDEVLETS